LNKYGISKDLLKNNQNLLEDYLNEKNKNDEEVQLKYLIMLNGYDTDNMNHCKKQEILPTKESIIEINKSDSCDVKNKQDSLTNIPLMRFVEEMAEPIGGINTIYKFIQDNLIYPEEAKSKGIEGGVAVEFIIEGDGTITNVKILQGLHPDLDEEAIRVVNMFPKWKPCKTLGKPVRCYFQLLVSFTLH